MKKEQKLIKAAMEALGYKYDTGSPKTIKEIKDREGVLSDCIERMTVLIEESKECIECWEEEKSSIIEMLQQIKVEELRLKNPNAKDVFFINT